MTPEQFHQLALHGYNRIPVSREILSCSQAPLGNVYLPSLLDVCVHAKPSGAWQ
jgi:hypothetical protein